MTPDDPTLRRYLLGQLDEAEAEALEAQVLADADLFEAVEAAHAELVDDYVSGALEGAERAAFEARILASEEGRSRVALARALQQKAADEAPSLWSRLARWLWPPVAGWRTLVPLAATAAAAALVFVLVRPGGGPTPGGTPGGPPIVELSVDAATLRSEANIPELSVDAATRTVRIHLRLPEDEPATRVRLTLRLGAEVRWADDIGVEGVGRAIQVEIPAASWGQGRHELAGEALKNGQPETPIFFFEVDVRNTSAPAATPR